MAKPSIPARRRGMEKKFLQWSLERQRRRAFAQGDWGAAAYLAYRTVRRVVVVIIGSTVLLVGIALLVLPGPAMLVIPAGLAILATELAWARRLLARARTIFMQAKNRIIPPKQAEKDKDPAETETADRSA